MKHWEARGVGTGTHGRRCHGRRAAEEDRNPAATAVTLSEPMFAQCKGSLSAATILIKRKRDDVTEPNIETQHRKVLGKPPIAYTCALGSCLTQLQPLAPWKKSIPKTITGIVTS